MLELELEEIYEKWQNDLQNVTGLDQAIAFNDALQINFDHYRLIFESELKMLKINTNDCLKNLERLINMLKKINDDEQNNKLKREIEDCDKLKAKSFEDKKKLYQLRNKFYQKSREFTFQGINVYHDYLRLYFNGRNRGLTTERIQMFQPFTADESHVDDQCSICVEEIDVGRRMRRLTCDGQHYFCQECIEKWFAEHNTCPLCRHIFE